MIDGVTTEGIVEGESKEQLERSEPTVPCQFSKTSGKMIEKPQHPGFPRGPPPWY